MRDYQEFKEMHKCCLDSARILRRTPFPRHESTRNGSARQSSMHRSSCQGSYLDKIYMRSEWRTSGISFQPRYLRIDIGILS